MKKIYALSTLVILLCLNTITYAQNCGEVYGTGYAGVGSSIGIRKYDFGTNLYSPVSLINTALFVAPNTMNNGGPIAIDPLTQEINYHTDATAPRRIALFNFSSSSLNIVNFPAALDAAVGEQVYCSFRILELARKFRWANFQFHPLKLKNPTGKVPAKGIDYLSSTNWPPIELHSGH